MNNLNSKVETNKDLVGNGTELLYCDMDNYMSFTVTDVDSESFECINNETQQEEVYFFNELQIGWDFK